MLNYLEKEINVSEINKRLTEINFIMNDFLAFCDENNLKAEIDYQYDENVSKLNPSKSNITVLFSKRYVGDTDYRMRLPQNRNK